MATDLPRIYAHLTQQRQAQAHMHPVVEDMATYLLRIQDDLHRTVLLYLRHGAHPHVINALLQALAWGIVALEEHANLGETPE